MAHKTSLAFRSLANTLRIKSGLVSSRNPANFARFLSSGELISPAPCENNSENCSPQEISRQKQCQQVHNCCRSSFHRLPWPIRRSCRPNRRRKSARKKVLWIYCYHCGLGLCSMKLSLQKRRRSRTSNGSGWSWGSTCSACQLLDSVFM